MEINTNFGIGFTDRETLPRRSYESQEEPSCELQPSTENTHSSLVLAWLAQNYEERDGSCLPRCMLYEHYVEFCKDTGCPPIGAAIFGKLIHTKFRSLTTRRLGTRGQSKYHYYGIALKESPSHTPKATLRLTRFSSLSDSQQYEQTKKQGKHPPVSILEGFPKLLKIETSGRETQKNFSKIESFLIMYKAHCQRVLEAVVAANFDDVKSFILHFWSGIPPHVTDVLSMDEIGDLISACDTVFYKKLIDILIPSSVQDVPESYRSEITNFTKCFLPWLDICLMNVPSNLAAAKMKVAKAYIKIIQRHLTFLSFAQPVLSILSNRDHTKDIAKDFQTIDVLEVLGVSTTSQADKNSEGKSFLNDLRNLLNEVVHLLTRQAPVGAFLGLLDKLVHDMQVRSAQISENQIGLASSSFVLQLSLVLSRLTQQLTLNSAKTFGSIHILCSMIMEYLFLAIESTRMRDEEQSIWEKVKPFSCESSEGAVKGKKRKLEELPVSNLASKKQHLQENQDKLNKQQQQQHEKTSLHGTPYVTSPKFRLAKTDYNNNNNNMTSLSHNQRYFHDNAAKEARDAVALLPDLPSLQDMVNSYGWADFHGFCEELHSDDTHHVNAFQSCYRFNERGLEPAFQKIC